MLTGIYAIAALSGFLFGYDTAIVNGALFQLKSDFNIPLLSWQSALIVSIALVGAFVGSCGAGFVGTRYGRRATLLLGSALFTVGSTGAAASTTLGLLYVFRFVLGLGVGVASVIAPVYLAEMSPASTRGRVVIMNTFFITGAQFVAALVAAALVLWSPDHVGWRVMFGLGTVPAVLQGALLLSHLPESPRWLRCNGRVAEAAEVERRFFFDAVPDLPTGTADGDAAPSADETLPLRGGVSAAAGGADDATFVLSALIAPGMRRRLLVGMGLQIAQQLSGVNCVQYFSGSILAACGFRGDHVPVLWGVPLAFTNAAFTLVGMFIVDRFGRRPALLCSAGSCLVATLLMGVVGLLVSADVMSTGTGGACFLCLMFAYLACFAPGLGCVPWVVNSEIFPTPLRSAAAAVATMANWGSNAVVSQAFPVLLGSAIGPGGTFLVVSAFVVASFCFVYLCVPETKSRSLEEIERDWDPSRRVGMTATG